MRKTFNAIFDIVTGFDLESMLKKVLEMDSWDRDAIEKYQQYRFEILTKHALTTKIYKNIKENTIKAFPIYSKEYVQKNFADFLTYNKKPFRIIYTSGSSGNPKKIYVSKDMLLAKRVSHLKMLNWYNLKREDKEVYIGGLSQSIPTRVYYFLKNKIYLQSNNLTKQRAREYIKIINKHKPKILFSYPYALDIILGYAEQFKESLHQPVVVYTSGEALYPHIKEHIKVHFPNSHIVNEYWSTEANIGVSCPEGNIHVDEDTVHLETINNDKDGFGDLLITNFFSYDMPLIRYDIGDRVKLTDKVCSCGRKTKIIDGIQGRVADYYDLKDGRRIAYMDMRIAKFVDNVIVYQVIHHKKDDKCTFRYVPKNASKAIDFRAIKKFFKKNLGVELLFEMVDQIPSEPSGKFKVFKSI